MFDMTSFDINSIAVSWLSMHVFNVSTLIAVLVVFITYWSWLPLDNWWVRVADFPRLQVAYVGCLVFVVMWGFLELWLLGHQVLMVLLTIALGFQLKMVLPYTPFWRKQVKTTKRANVSKQHQVNLLISNVLTSNNNTQALIDLIYQKNPDIIITLETDFTWQKSLSILEQDYAYHVNVPLDNLYGMHLYSKLELIEPSIKYLMVDDIPSIHTRVRLGNGRVVWLYCLHPMPPSPTEADKSTTRDAELMMIARMIRDNQQLAIVAGDFNDVAWSKTSRLFQAVSGLLDPRVGRGFLNTFPVQLPLCRWALDHVFHSACFTLVDMQRLPSIHSDHFPLMTVLQYSPEKAQIHGQQSFGQGNNLQMMNRLIKNGHQEGHKVSLQRREAEAIQQQIFSTHPSADASTQLSQNRLTRFIKTLTLFKNT